ncbi:UNVERIFIED_CONTAM: hypothetical protein RMT77_011447 [Armadillidium vulgare]
MIKKYNVFILWCIFCVFLWCLCLVFTSTFISQKVSVSDMEEKLQRNLIEYYPKFKRVIIVTKARSGSSWTGSLMAENPGIYYTFEPLAYFDLAEIIENITTPSQEKKFFNEIMMCDFMKHQNYFESLIATGLIWKNLINRDFCNFNIVPSFCTQSNIQYLQTLCQTSKLHLIKTFLNLQSIISINNFNNLNTGIIHLIRDPRATVLSRMELTQHALLESHCEKLRQEINLGPQIYNSKRYYRVRYEDLALNPIEETKKLYKFVGLKYTIFTELLIRSTSFDDSLTSDPFALRRRSSSRAFRWRNVMSFDQVQRIQEHCQDVLEKLNYRIFNTIEEYKNSSIPVLLFK